MNKEIKDLKNIITEANKSYRSGNPTMSDIEYDNLLEKYQSNVSEEEYNDFRDSLNEGIIEDTKQKITHKYIAGSLDKIKAENPKDVENYLRKYIKNKLCISAKVDGLSGIAKYENGILTGFSTRGDGTTGISIFNKAKYIKYLPKKIDIEEEIYIRGELVILKEDYDKIEGTSARNIVAGLINRLEYNPEEIKNISFISYTIMGPKYSKREQFEILERNKFNTTWYEYISFEQLFSKDFNEYLFETASKDFEMQTDGLVLIDSEGYNEEKYRPSNSVAYKINQQVFTSQLLDIEWQGPSMNGKMCPVGIIEETQVGGVCVKRVTLNNLDFIETQNLMINDYITLTRSGDVIPKLLSVENYTNTSHKIQYPTHCPCCKSTLVREGPFLYCKNENCIDKTTSQIETLIKNLEIENASFKTLKNFGIYDIKTLLNFKARLEYKSETKFIEELNNKLFTKTEDEIFCNMNMKDFAYKTLKTIVKFYGWDNIKNGNIDTSKLPQGIGNITINKFLNNYKKNLDNLKMITEDSRYNNYKKETKIIMNENNGMSICFTGKLNTMGRTEASKIAQEKGYEVKNSVTKGLTYLVTNTPDSGTSKNKKAQEFGTKIITEEEFLEMMK